MRICYSQNLIITFFYMGCRLRDFCSPPEIWSENNRSLHNNRFCPLKIIPGRKPKAKSIYHWYLIMHMGRKLKVLWNERELGNSVMLFTCFCCHCCPSQCALLTQCPIGHLVLLKIQSRTRCTFQIWGGWQGRRTWHLPPSLPPPLWFSKQN